MLEIDDDAVLWSAPAEERAGRPLLLVLHGLGSNERDLFGLAPYLPDAYVIASLRAPLPHGPGWAWFPIEPGRQGDPRAEIANEGTDAVLRWLDRAAPDAASVTALGFSQGGAMSLQLLRRAPERIRAAVNLSGFVVDDPDAADDALAAARPPVFWGRGDADQVITPAAIARTEAWTPAHTAAVITVYPGLPHSIAQQELTDVVAFLAQLG